MINAALMQAPEHVAKAVQNASARTGVDFSYLLKQAQVESSFDTDIRSKSSSATGLYQFIDQTWLRMVKEHGAEHGQSGWANAITQGRDGRFHVADKNMRHEILNARTDADFSALMAGEYAAENKRIIESKTSRNANATDLYMAHFLGSGGATTFLNALQDNPLQKASVIFPSAAASNRAVFYNPDGSPRTLAQVYDRFAAKFGTDESIGSSPSSVLRLGDTAAAAPLTPSSSQSLTNESVASDLALGWAGEPSSHGGRGTSSARYGVYETTPIQSMIGSDLLSSSLLTLFSGGDETQERGRGEERGFFASLKDSIIDAFTIDA